MLRRCQQRAIEIFFEEVGPRRLTPRQFALLVTIAQRPGLSQTDLVDVTGIDRSTVGDMLERLLKRGLVRRRRSGRDQRTNTLYVQPAGLKAVHDTIPAVERAQARILGPLPEDMRPAFVAALRLMAGIVETPAPKPSR
ncbi:MAG: winged helix-turn-helix transcriptional regulator [Rhodospirillales bacterium]|nr:winged helix-turn-helix transcriptional regulator [Rhodospirillales bacterium]